MLRRRACLTAALMLCLVPRPGFGQESRTDSPGLFLGINALIGGIGALVHSFAPSSTAGHAGAFLYGALGGVVTYGGQRLVGTAEPALRLPGVQVAALGANVARNAGEGKGLLSDLVFPVYPFYLRVRAGAANPVSVRVSAIALAGLGRGLLTEDHFQARLDWRESLLTGAPVFRSTSSYLYPSGSDPAPDCMHGDGCAGNAAGLHWLGTSWYATGGRSAESSRRILAHEVIHLTQIHRDAILYAIPVSDDVLERAGGPFETVAHFIVLDGFLPIGAANSIAARTITDGAEGGPWRLYEREARSLAGR